MIFDLIGIGIGPFNLSLAALLEKAQGTETLFLDKKPKFDWHPELMFSDSIMQTSYLTDLVTPVDPTNPYSFLNYLCHKNLFYSFLNTERVFISRMEFEQYCQWVSKQLAHKLKFNREVRQVTFADGLFTVHTDTQKFLSKNICVATGLSPRIPEFARPFIGNDVFYAKSPQLAQMNVTNKSVVVVGGGQTGIEIFSNILQGQWGHAKSIRMITARNNLEAYDGSPFTSEYFTPAYLDMFWDIEDDKKANIVEQQLLLSDGNTPSYLLKLYNDLYQKKYVEEDPREMVILAQRKLIGINRGSAGYRLTIMNGIHECEESMDADVVILCTGLKSDIPQLLEPIFPLIEFDVAGRFVFNKSYTINWHGPKDNRIYALNFSRHQHGIIDPQTNMMAWRSAVVVNDLTRQNIYQTDAVVRNFVEFDRYTNAQFASISTGVN